MPLDYLLQSVYECRHLQGQRDRLMREQTDPKTKQIFSNGAYCGLYIRIIEITCASTEILQVLLLRLYVVVKDADDRMECPYLT